MRFKKKVLRRPKFLIAAAYLMCAVPLQVSIIGSHLGVQPLNTKYHIVTAWAGPSATPLSTEWAGPSATPLSTVI